ncbi:MAG: ABC transporter permease [Lachnospiraceae bacterium]
MKKNNKRTVHYQKLKNVKNIVLMFIVPAALVLLWHFLSKAEVFPALLRPNLATLWKGFLQNLNSGILFKDISSSLLIEVKGYLIGAGLGFLLGMAMGYFKTIHQLLAPVLNCLRQIPPLAWIPLLILWFGISDVSMVTLIVLSSFFPVLLNTINGIQEVPAGYLELSKNYQIKKKDVFFKILLPGAAPSIFVGLRLGAGTAWMSIVAAEMVAATAGVGYRINDSRNLMRTDLVLVYMIVIALIGGLIDFGIRKLAQRISAWQRK